MDIKVCTCHQCKARKKGMSTSFKKRIKRMINKKRRSESFKVFNFYYS